MDIEAAARLHVVSGPDGRRFVEGVPGQSIVRTAQHVTAIVEACLSHQVALALLYSDNLPVHFFDLSSGDAGEILQKCRNYGIRLAVVCAPDVRRSRRFGEMEAEESRGPHFRVFEARTAAEAWLCRD